jgi:hypothetical protein
MEQVDTAIIIMITNAGKRQNKKNKQKKTKKNGQSRCFVYVFRTSKTNEKGHNTEVTNVRVCVVYVSLPRVCVRVCVLVCSMRNSERLFASVQQISNSFTLCVHVQLMHVHVPIRAYA